MTDGQDREEGAPKATSRSEVHNNVAGGEFHGPLIQAGTITGGVHSYHRPPRWSPSKQQVRHAAGITAAILGLAAIAGYYVNRERYDHKFSSPPYVCGTIWQNPNFERWVPGAKEGTPPEIGPELTSCSWVSPSQKAEVSVIVFRWRDRAEAKKYFDRAKSGEDVRSGQDMIHQYEPGIGDDADISMSVPAGARAVQAGETSQWAIAGLGFRRYNVEVELRRAQDRSGYGGDSDSILREMAFVIDAQLKS